MSQHTPAIQRPRRCPRSGVRALGRLKTRIARERAFYCVCRTNMDPFTTLRRSERAQLENVVKTPSNNRGFFPRLDLRLGSNDSNSELRRSGLSRVRPIERS